MLCLRHVVDLSYSPRFFQIVRCIFLRFPACAIRVLFAAVRPQRSVRLKSSSRVGPVQYASWFSWKNWLGFLHTYVLHPFFGKLALVEFGLQLFCFKFVLVEDQILFVVLFEWSGRVETVFCVASLPRAAYRRPNSRCVLYLHSTQSSGIGSRPRSGCKVRIYCVLHYWIKIIKYNL